MTNQNMLLIAGGGVVVVLGGWVLWGRMRQKEEEAEERHQRNVARKRAGLGRAQRIASGELSYEPLDWSDPELRAQIARSFSSGGMGGTIAAHGFSAGQSPYPYQMAALGADSYWHRDNPFPTP